MCTKHLAGPLLAAATFLAAAGWASGQSEERYFPAPFSRFTEEDVLSALHAAGSKGDALTQVSLWKGEGEPRLLALAACSELHELMAEGDTLKVVASRTEYGCGEDWHFDLARYVVKPGQTAI